MKHPPKQFTDSEAFGMLEDFIANSQPAVKGTYQPAPQDKASTVAK